MFKFFLSLSLLMVSSAASALDPKDFDLFRPKPVPEVLKPSAVPPDPMAGLLWSYRPGHGWGFHPIGTPGLVPGGGPGSPQPIVAPPQPAIPPPVLVPPPQFCPGGVCPLPR